ncbi:hypothetical protein ANANG_G00026190 [Anguilla anguilla]|uniref:C2H2-type domain-containing protein n=1 Tax=Anguilla anguilla TaxID=7936 RepID=A0A9D3N3B9_ANGAN|nr:hypothetical protein ANANG_G00026190 [Anguilla anguilla]
MLVQALGRDRLSSERYKSNEEYVYVRGRGRGKYVCEECGIRCKKPSMLKKHIRTHTDVRPYVCKHCNFAFKTKGNLTKHMKSKAHGKKCQEASPLDQQEPEEGGGDEERLGGSEDQEEHQFSDIDDSEDDDDNEEEEEEEEESSSHDEPPSSCSPDTRLSSGGRSDSGQPSQRSTPDPHPTAPRTESRAPASRTTRRPSFGPAAARLPPAARGRCSPASTGRAPPGLLPQQRGVPLRHPLLSPTCYPSPAPRPPLSPGALPRARVSRPSARDLIQHRDPPGQAGGYPCSPTTAGQ